MPAGHLPFAQPWQKMHCSATMSAVPSETSSAPSASVAATSKPL
jgi:hypothetical protein